MKQLLLCPLFVLLVSGCGKTDRSALDCAAASDAIKLEYATDPANARKVDYTIRYTGDVAITSVTFDYGDGKAESLAVLTGTHTYAQPGSYTVKATLTLQNSSGEICAITPAKRITIY
ncbi:PKD domain-containing protein [Chitinophaga sp. CB10]|uniref:PKD domain-containing protein n=1 Tax=Chitinophaga sp. CB10 TaxID=1891659 RepID=UPI0025BF37F0|nr:PKD domain-containing protein [Chitinophaga sp. CB10]